MTADEKNAIKNATAHAKNGLLSKRDIKIINRFTPHSADERILKNRAVACLKKR